MKVYIIGKITGLPREYVVEKFRKAEDKLKSAGMVVVNPVNLVPEDTTWNAAMRTCIGELVKCDAVALLSDWSRSAGGKLEAEIALQLNLEAIEV